MKILQLNIVEFGALKNRQITLEDGLNIITGENESGKSTVALFIKFMLYGLGRKNAKGTDRERALSFDGHRAVGSMRVQSGGELYVIERSATSGGRLAETLKVTELSSGRELSGEPGELFLGIPAEVFESSAYISQMRAADIKGVQGTAALENMLLSADESIDVSGVLSRIDRVRKEYKLNRGEGGLLYRTDKEISDLSSRLSLATQKHAEESEMAARLARINARLEQAEASLRASGKRLEDITNAKTVQKYDELCQKKKALELESEKLTSLKASMAKDGFVPSRAHISHLLSASGALELATKKRENCENALNALPQIPQSTLSLAAVGDKVLKSGGAQAALGSINASEKKRGTRTAAAVLSFALCGVGLLCAVVLFLLPTLIGAIVAGGVSVLCAVLGIIMISGASKAKTHRDSLCGEYGVPFADISDYIESALTAYAELLSFNQRNATASALLATARDDEAAAKAQLTAQLLRTLDTLDGDIMALCAKEIVRIGELCDRCEASEREIYALGRLVQSIQQELAGQDIDALRASTQIDVNDITPAVHDRARLAESFDRERTEKLRSEVKVVGEALAALRGGIVENPIELAEKIAVLKQKRDADGEYYDALMLAKEHIEAASAAMSKNVTPELARRAAQMMSTVSEGKHGELQMTKGLDVSLEQDGFLLPSELLSGGTRDAAYICLRLAILCRVCAKESSPVIMDETLCQLDDVRAGKMLSLISGLAQSMQFILFSCHAREVQMCTGGGIKANVIKLEK